MKKKLIGAQIAYKLNSLGEQDDFYRMNARPEALEQVIRQIVTASGIRELNLTLKYQESKEGRAKGENVPVKIDPQRSVDDILTEIRGYLGKLPRN